VDTHNVHRLLRHVEALRVAFASLKGSPRDGTTTAA
jgi:hypothetical protein